MFNAPYKFNKVGHQKAHHKEYFKTLSFYNFRTEKNLYTVEVEEYSYSIFIIKYYLRKNKHNPKKYNLLEGEYKCSRIVGTCVLILKSILQKRPNASFGFLGSFTIDGEKREPKHQTKRFGIYKYAVEDLIGINSFTHYMDVDNSTYLMVNNRNKDVDSIAEKANEMFVYLYPALADINE